MVAESTLFPRYSNIKLLSPSLFPFLLYTISIHFNHYTSYYTWVVGLMIYLLGCPFLWEKALARPKSANFNVPVFVMRTLAAFMSRWRICEVNVEYFSPDEILPKYTSDTFTSSPD